MALAPLGADADAARHSEAGFPLQPALTSGDPRLHHCERPADRDEPGEAHCRYPRRRRHHARDARSLAANIANTDGPTLAIGLAAILFLFWVRKAASRP